MIFLSPQQKQTLTLLADTLAPQLPPPDAPHNAALFSTNAVDLGIPDALEEALALVTDEQAKRELKQFFALLENPLVNWIIAGKWGAFSAQDLAGRTVILRGWGNSRWGVARRAFQGIKRMTLFLFYAYMPDEQPNPTWEAFHFSHPPAPSHTAPKPIQPLAITQDTNLSTEILIIGSGAGGGVVAGELATAGHEVMVLEKGGYYAEADFHGRELESNRALFENYAALTTADTSMSVLAGSTLGGGTTINWMASFRTPQDVLQEWETAYGFTGAAGADFQASLDSVARRINVNTDSSTPNAQNAHLERGAQALGYADVGVIARNVNGCGECGFCNFGCASGAKQGTLKTYLQDAHEHGAKIIVRAYAERITHQNGRVTGAIATVEDANGAKHRLSISARVVVVAAGAIHTPALLRRSGLSNPNIGANLHLHPVTSVVGQHTEPVISWQGAPMTRVVKTFANLDGRGYGYRIECPPAQPGVLGAQLPWQSGAQHRALMQHIRHFSHFIILVRDHYSGQVKVNKAGNPVLHYHLHPYDAKHLMHGLLEGIKIHQAAGAAVIYSPHNRFLAHHTQNEDIQPFIDRVRREGFKPNAYALFSAHQMSSCRIGGDSQRGALQPNGESWEVKNLFVADASVFPTASGVNPMLSIMATSHFLAQGMKR